MSRASALLQKFGLHSELRGPSTLAITSRLNLKVTERKETLETIIILQSFLDPCSFFLRFAPKFTSIAAPSKKQIRRNLLLMFK